ncbi:hypothetical protein OHR68_10000 [Spirillospora sp. NBC_00431]
MANPDVVARIETSEPRTGGWCDRCALPSLVEVDVTVFGETTNGTPLAVSTSTAAHCTNCEESND